MPLRAADVEIERPCPVDLDETGLRGTGRNWHCGHCSKTVHVLSTMTESEARTFLREHAGEDLCVSYAISPAGEVRFRPEPIVPLSSLSRTRRVAAAAGLGLALAACAPHDNPEVRVSSQDLVHVPTPSTPTIPTQVAAPEPPASPPRVADLQVDGGMRAPDLQVEGGMKVRDEPCDPPQAPLPKRGGIRARR